MQIPDHLIGKIRVYSILLWTAIFNFLSRYGFQLDDASKETIYVATAILFTGLLYTLVDFLSKKYPKQFWWLQYLFTIPTPPNYEAKSK